MYNLSHSQKSKTFLRISTNTFSIKVSNSERDVSSFRGVKDDV